MREAIWSPTTTKQVGWVEGQGAYDMKGNRLYDVDGRTLMDPVTKKIVGYLSDAGAVNSVTDTTTDRLFPSA